MTLNLVCHIQWQIKQGLWLNCIKNKSLIYIKNPSHRKQALASNKINCNLIKCEYLKAKVNNIIAKIYLYRQMKIKNLNKMNKKLKNFNGPNMSLNLNFLVPTNYIYIIKVVRNFNNFNLYSIKKQIKSFALFQMFYQITLKWLQ